MTAFRLVRDIIVILACLCVMLLTAELVAVEAKIGSAVSRYEQQSGAGDPTPAPGTTGCPFGADQCGG